MHPDILETLSGSAIKKPLALRVPALPKRWRNGGYHVKGRVLGRRSQRIIRGGAMKKDIGVGSTVFPKDISQWQPLVPLTVTLVGKGLCRCN